MWSLSQIIDRKVQNVSSTYVGITIKTIRVDIISKYIVRLN